MGRGAGYTVVTKGLKSVVLITLQGQTPSKLQSKNRAQLQYNSLDACLLCAEDKGPYQKAEGPRPGNSKN
jgi:hypothetical protein